MIKIIDDFYKLNTLYFHKRLFGWNLYHIFENDINIPIQKLENSANFSKKAGNLEIRNIGNPVIHNSICLSMLGQVLCFLIL